MDNLALCIGLFVNFLCMNTRFSKPASFIFLGIALAKILRSFE